jgi:hypothetical protein
VVSTTPRLLYPRERPGIHCTGGWVGPRAGLDVCEKSRPHRDFFVCFCISLDCSVSCTLFWYCSDIRRRTACRGFFRYEKSDGFGRERTRNLGFQRPARKPLDHRSRYGFDPWTVQPVVSRYTDWATQPTHRSIDRGFFDARN